MITSTCPCRRSFSRQFSFPLKCGRKWLNIYSWKGAKYLLWERHERRVLCRSARNRPLWLLYQSLPRRHTAINIIVLWSKNLILAANAYCHCYLMKSINLHISWCLDLHKQFIVCLFVCLSICFSRGREWKDILLFIYQYVIWIPVRD